MNLKQINFKPVTSLHTGIWSNNSIFNSLTFQQGISIWRIDRTLSDATTPNRCWPGSNGNKRVLLIPRSSTTEVPPSDGFCTGQSLGGSYSSVETQLVYFTTPVDLVSTSGQLQWSIEHLEYISGALLVKRLSLYGMESATQVQVLNKLVYVPLPRRIENTSERPLLRICDPKNQWIYTFEIIVSEKVRTNVSYLLFKCDDFTIIHYSFRWVSLFPSKGF